MDGARATAEFRPGVRAAQDALGQFSTAARRTKFGNRRVRHADGYVFDSQAEAARYAELCLLAQAGVIRGLHVHPRYPLKVQGVHIATYVADFAYEEWSVAGWHSVTQDVKGVRTPAYRLKAKLFAALYGRAVVEVAA